LSATATQARTSEHRKNIYAKVNMSVKKVLMTEGIKGQQLLFITKAIMEEAKNIKIGHRMRNIHQESTILL
jgi:type I restriction enzyme R subunit